MEEEGKLMIRGCQMDKLYMQRFKQIYFHSLFVFILNIFCVCEKNIVCSVLLITIVIARQPQVGGNIHIISTPNTNTL